MADSPDDQQVGGPPAGQSAGPVSYQEFLNAKPDTTAKAGAPAQQNGPVSYDEFMKATPPASPNVDENDSFLSQLGQREWAGARTALHGVLSIPAGVVGLPAMAGKVLQTSPGPVTHLAGEGLSAIGDAVEPVRAGLQSVADAIAPKAQPNEIGYANDPTFGKIILGAADAAGGGLGGYGLGVAAGKVLPAIGSVGAKIARLVGIGSDDAAPVSGVSRAPIDPGVGSVVVRLNAKGMSPGAARMILGAHAQATPESLAAANAPGGLVADAFPSLARYARGASDETRTALDAAYAGRDATRLDRLTDPLEDATGVQRGNLSQTIDDLVAHQKATAAQLYPQAYFNPDGSLRTVSSPEINAIIDQNPEFAKAWPVARRLVQDEHGVDIGDVPSGDARVPGLTSAQVKSLQSNGYTPEMIQRLAQHTGAAPSAQAIPVIGLQYLKEGVDDVIANGMGKDGRIGPRVATLLSNKLAQMRTLADAQNPEWGAARAAFSDDATAQEAAAQGARDILNPHTSGYEIQRNLAALQPSDQVLYKQTALDQVLQRAENADWTTSGAADPVKQILTGLGGPEKFRALAATPEKYQEFMDALQPVVGQRALQKFVTAGSQTADKAQMASFYNELAAPTPAALAATAGSGINPSDVIGMVRSPVRTALAKGLAAAGNKAKAADAAASAASDAATQAQRAGAAREVGALLTRPGAHVPFVVQAAQARGAAEGVAASRAQAAVQAAARGAASNKTAALRALEAAGGGSRLYSPSAAQ